MQTENGFRIAGGQIPTHYGSKTYVLENLRLSHRVNVADLLALLNGEAVYPHVDPRRRLLPTPTPRILALRGSEDDTRTAEVQLRELVDEWLDSAIDESGTERPASRSLKGRDHDTTKSTPAQMAIWTYSRTLKLLVDYTGSIVLSGEEPRLPFTPRPGTYSFLFPDDPKNWLNHEQSAQAYFVSMMLSPLAQRIAKCRAPGCGKYFQIKHPNHPYIGGTHCPTHAVDRLKRARKSLNADGRSNAVERLYEACVAKFSTKMQDAGWEKKTTLLNRMVDELNMLIAGDSDLRTVYPKGITTAWFGRKKNVNGIRAVLAMTRGKAHATR